MTVLSPLEWLCDVQATIKAGKSAPSPPPAPDPVASAGAQGQANVSTAAAQSALNNTNTVSPYGSTSYDITGNYTSPNGETVPTYTQTTTLNPNEQAALTNQQTLAKTLSGYGNQIADTNAGAITKPMDFNALPKAPTSLDLSGAPAMPNPGDFQNEADQATNASYQQAHGLIAPGQEYARQQLASQMNNAGIPITSGAAQQQDNLLATQQMGQDNNLAYGAVGAGQAEQQALFGQAATARGQAVNEAGQNAGLTNQAIQTGMQEQTLAQDQPINVLSALLQGGGAIQGPQVGSPSQTGVSPTDVLGAQSLQQNARNAAYQGAVSQANAGNQAEAGIAAAALSAAIMSDRRLKEDIRRIGTADNGLPIYAYRYLGSPVTQIGFMADEVAAIHPQAVIVPDDGYARVLYAEAVQERRAA